MVDQIAPDVVELTPVHIHSLGSRKERHSGQLVSVLVEDI
jgi:hypothetical protein